MPSDNEQNRLSDEGRDASFYRRSLRNGVTHRHLQRMRSVQMTSPSSKMHVLVTGGAGFVGSNLVRRLLSLGYEVYVVDNLITGRKENVTDLLGNKHFHFYHLDITDREFSSTFSCIPINRIYHLACPTGVPNISTLGIEMLLTSSVGTLAVLEVARTRNASVLFTSSCEVYGQPEVFPQHVEYCGNVSPIGPRSPYEEGKRFSESLLITFVRKYGLDAKIVRIFNTFGPAMSPDDQRVIPRFLRSIARQEKITVYGHGQQQRTFLYIDDLLAGLLLVMEQGESGEVYNIGGTREITMKELAELVILLTDHKEGIVFLPHFTEDHTRRMPDVSKMEKLGWKPSVSLQEGVKSMIARMENDGYYTAAPRETYEVIAWHGS